MRQHVADGANRPCPRPRRAARGVLAALALAVPAVAQAWGDVGHRVVALIAEHHLDAGVRHRVFALLATDPGHLTVHDIDSEATWADRFRDSDRNGTRLHFERTRRWHFVDIEIAAPDLDRACFHHPVLPAGTPASLGPPVDCVVDKIDHFAAELRSPSTTDVERLQALQFLLHFVGDVHQPLHASDASDAGGNGKRVHGRTRPPGTLHLYWDTEFVITLGGDAPAIASRLIGQITPQAMRDWSVGTAADWAMESFAVGRDTAYGRLPPPKLGVYALSASYEARAKKAVELQLEKAGVRLASVLNRALAP